MFFQIFQLRPENILTGGKPEDDLFRVLLDQMERDVAFPRSGRMDDGSFSVFFHHPDRRPIGFLIVLKQFQHHTLPPPHNLEYLP